MTEKLKESYTGLTDDENIVEFYYCTDCCNKNNIPITEKITGEECEICKKVKHCNTYTNDILRNRQDIASGSSELDDKDPDSSGSEGATTQALT